MQKIFTLLFSLFLFGCTTQTQVQQAPVQIERLEFTQRWVVPNIQTARMKSSFEHVAVANTEESPREIRSLNTDKAQWLVFEKRPPKPTQSEGIAGEGIKNGLMKNIYFALDSSDFDDDAYIKDLSFKLKAISGQVYIYGYTDRSGTEERNKELALERANVVTYKLIAAGVSEERIKSFAGGVSRTFKNDAQNRRASIYFKIDR